MYNPFQLTNKTILITGASSGIGRATAVECAKLGAKCIITARNSARLQETYRLLDGENHCIVEADLTNAEERDLLIQKLPVIDGFVNNAGISITKLISFVNQGDLDSVFATNTFAPFLLTKGLLKKKKISKGGSVVIMSSLAAMKESYGNAVYGMTKAAIMSFAKYCALEVGNKLIRVNSIHPGMVCTEMLDGLVFSNEEIEAERKKYPLQRFGKPEEIAWMIVYLLSDASNWVTGSSFVIDGGIHLV